MKNTQDRWIIETINGKRFDIDREDFDNLTRGEFIYIEEKVNKICGLEMDKTRFLWVNKNYIRKIELTEK